MKKVLDFFRDPLWRGISGFWVVLTGFLLPGIIVIWGVISGGINHLGRKYQIVLNLRLWQTIIILVFCFVILFITIKRTYQMKKQRTQNLVKDKYKPIRIHGVDWEIRPSDSGHIEGPLCPIHHLPMEVKDRWENGGSRKRVYFICLGEKEDSEHEISGPLVDNLIKKNLLRDRLELNVRRDAWERIKAKRRTEFKVMQ